MVWKLVAGLANSSPELGAKLLSGFAKGRCAYDALDIPGEALATRPPAPVRTCGSHSESATSGCVPRVQRPTRHPVGALE